MNGRKGPRLLEHVLWDAAFRSPRSDVTLSNYSFALRRWARAGVVKVADVTPESAQRFVEGRLAAGRQPQTVAPEFSAVMALLDHEERAGRFKTTLLERIRRCAPTKPRRKELCAPYLTAEQVEQFCAAAETDLAFLVRLAAYTGLRAGELARLAWGDVDLARRVLHVRKGKTGPRWVPLCSPALELLRPRVGLPGDRVLGATARALQERLRKARRVAGLKVTMTLLRHTRASWWIQGGVPIAVVAKALGHSVATCLHYYGGLDDAYSPVFERGAAG